MLSFIIALSLSADAQASSIRRYEVTAENKTKPIEIKAAPNRIASVRFNRPFEQKALYCGDGQRFLVQAIDDIQVNVKAINNDYGRETNCIVMTKTGVPVVLNIVTTDPKRADSFVDVIFATSDLPSTEVELSRRLQEVQQTFESKLKDVQERCRDDADEALVKQVAQSIVAQHINSRGIRADVLITVTDIVKLSDRIFVRLELDNQSRDPFVVGEVEINVTSSDAKDPFKLERLVPFFQRNVLDRNESTLGAVAFTPPQLPRGARLALKVLERNGSRHLEIKDLRL